jgi:hypothetical protein
MIKASKILIALILFLFNETTLIVKKIHIS